MKNKSEHFDTVYKEADRNMYQNKRRYGKEMKRKTIDMLLHKLNQKYHELRVHNEKVSKYSYEFAKAIISQDEICGDFACGSCAVGYAANEPHPAPQLSRNGAYAVVF